MRVPWRAFHRAFPELDRFTDAQCRDMIRRVLWQQVWWTLVVSLGAVVLCLAIVLITLVAAVIVSRLSIGRAWEIELIGVGMLVGSGLGFLAALVIRDVYVRSRIRSWVGSSRCSQCGYSLLGLHADSGRIACPECGLSNDIASRGLDPATLVPRV